MRKLASVGFGLVCLFAVSAASAATATVLYSFDAAVDGFSPHDLLAGDDGNLYGVVSTDSSGASAVFKLTPAGQLTRLASFTDNVVLLTKGTTGNLFGVANAPGDFGTAKTLFRLTPAGVLSVLHTFSSADGITSVSTLLQASDGKLYGTGGGKLFKFVIATGVLTTLHAFSDDDGSPANALLQGADGLLYGGTSFGGPGTSSGGTTFRSTLAGAFTVLNSVGSDTLMQAADGNLYGTWEDVFCCEAGDASGYIRKITTSGAVSPVAQFNRDGLDVPNRLVQAVDGNLYTTTSKGGALGGNGTVIRMTPAGRVARIHAFGYAPGEPFAGTLSPLVLAKDGNLYGAGSLGGSHFSGSIFRVDNPGADVVNFTPFLGSAALLQEQACKTARVLDANNVARPNAPVTFTRTGANPAAAVSKTTDASGTATYCYSGTHAGIDTVTAHVAGFDDRTRVGWNLRPSLLVADGYIRRVSATKVEIGPRARLTDSRSGAPIAGAVVRFSSYSGIVDCPADPYQIQYCLIETGGDMCSAKTDANGYASCRTTVSDHLDVVVAGRYTAYFNGDSVHQSTSDAGLLR